MVEERNSWGNPWQPKAADTNMLRVHLVGGPIFKDFDLESGGIGGERRGKRGGSKNTKNTDELTHTTRKVKSIAHTGDQPVQLEPPRAS